MQVSSDSSSSSGSESDSMSLDSDSGESGETFARKFAQQARLSHQRQEELRVRRMQYYSGLKNRNLGLLKS